MDITVYLPDELGERARKAEPKLHFSQLFRTAVADELERRDTLAASRDGMVEQQVHTSETRYSENPYNERPVILRFTGKQLAGDDDTTVWLVKDGRVLLEDAMRYDTFDDAKEFADWVHNWETRNNLGASAEEALRDAVAALGIVPVIDL